MAAGADGGDYWYAVFVRGAGFEQFAGDAAGQFEDFLGVAVIDLEDGGAALGLDAEALEAEFVVPSIAVDGLGVVVEDEQRIGVRVDHLGDELEPCGLEVVAFVDEHGVVLAGRDDVGVDGVDDAVDEFAGVGVAVLAVFRQAGVVGDELGAAPLVEGVDVHLVGQPLGVHGAAQAFGQGAVVAEH